MKIFAFLGVRLFLAILIAIKVVDVLFATALTFAFRMNLHGLTEFLGQLTPGDNYRRLIPLMETIPLWLHGLAIVAAGLYLVAIVQVLWRRGRTYTLILAALVVEVITTLAGRSVSNATGVRANPNPSVIAWLFIPMLLPLFLALVLWILSRQPISNSSQPD